MVTPKIPGWGLLRPEQTRTSPNGQKEFLICPEGHDAPFWADLHEVHRHNGRIIYEETNHGYGPNERSSGSPVD